MYSGSSIASFLLNSAADAAKFEVVVCRLVSTADGDAEGSYTLETTLEPGTAVNIIPKSNPVLLGHFDPKNISTHPTKY